jgi:cytidylate kinase
MGDEVAQAIANRLNYRIICRDLINQAALRAGVPEMALAAIDDLGLFGIHPSRQDRSAYQQAMQDIMQEIADTGQVIIIGRAGQVILRNYPAVLHVMVIAPFNVRVGRIAQGQNITVEAAAAQIETSDRSRRNYLRQYYHARWDNPELYDLVVNTYRLSPDQAACLVCQSLSHCILQPHDQSLPEFHPANHNNPG